MEEGKNRHDLRLEALPHLFEYRLSQANVLFTHPSVELGSEPGPQFYPVSAIDYLTGYLMAFGALVALERRTREGGSWLVRISLAQTGRWLVEQGQVSDAESKRAAPEFTKEELERWSIESETPVGRLRHLGPVLQLSETPPCWARPSVPLGHNNPVWPERTR